MPNKFEMEKLFDEVWCESIPLILFSFPEQAQEVLGTLRILYLGFEYNDQTKFDQAYTKMTETLQNKKVTTYNEHDMNKFVNRRENYEHRFGELEKRIEKISSRGQSLSVAQGGEKLLSTDKYKTYHNKKKRIAKLIDCLKMRPKKSCSYRWALKEFDITDDTVRRCKTLEVIFQPKHKIIKLKELE